MNHFSSRPHFRQFQRIGRRLILAGALAMALTMPSGAEDRAVKQRVPPVYPEVAKRMRVEGVVKLSVTVDAQMEVRCWRRRLNRGSIDELRSSVA